MLRLVFATSNAHKLQEVSAILPSQITIVPLEETAWSGEIEETASTLEGNALLKAHTIANALEADCFAEDTGLEVDALNGEPGVYSARYAGPGRDARENMHRLLQELEGVHDRGAQFRTVIALVLDGAPYTFQGIVRGKIAHHPEGTGGFGYDPVFVPDGYSTSFGVLPSGIKNQISHRALAVQRLAQFLSDYIKCKNPG